MGTEPKKIEDMQRPMRRMGDVARAMLGCPLCCEGPLWKEQHPVRVVAYRRNTMRLECPVCGLRFSVDLDGVQAAVNAVGGALPFLANVIVRAER